MTTMQQLANGQTFPEVIINENFVSLEHQAVYGKDPETTGGLVWGYLGGRWGGFAITAGTFTLTGSTTNYLVVERATGTQTASTSATNWNDATNYARVYKLTTSGSAVTAEEDHRGGPGGVHGGAGGASSSFSAVVTVSGTSHNIANSEKGQYQRFTSGSAKTCTFRANATHALDDNVEFHLRCVGAGSLTLVAAGGVTLNVPSGGTLVLSDGMTVTVKRVTTDEFDVMGQTVPV